MPKKSLPYLALALGVLVTSVFAVHAESTADRAQQTANLLNQNLRAHGALKLATAAERAELQALNDGLKTKQDRAYLPYRLAANGWNGVGGGGGMACFTNFEDAGAAKDPAGRFRREALSKVVDIVPFDFYRIIASDPKRVRNAQQGISHMRSPREGESAELFLKRVLLIEILPRFPLLAERLIAILDAFPMSSWTPISTPGLPMFQDVQQKTWRSIVTPEMPCVYAQLAIRYVDNQKQSAERVYFAYDKDLVDLMSRISRDKTEFQQRLSFLILHEVTYFLARELGAHGAEQVDDIVELVLFDDADLQQFKIKMYQPQHPSDDILNQAVDEVFAPDYEQVLGQQTIPVNGISQLSLYRTWVSLMRRELVFRRDQEFCGCDGPIDIPSGRHVCYTGGALLLVRLLGSAEAVENLSDEEAFLSYAPEMSIDGLIPSPEVLVSSSVDGRGHFRAACQNLKTPAAWERFQDLLKKDIVTFPEPALMSRYFAKVRGFCAHF